ncbi:EVE domain-containing protein [Desulfosarcina sp. OttesenSCG-928-G10]|nr:EVE domain-containing protein [Desulfosarcina sp. OttesenSCG-928-G10]MDL2320817.1 EVE domain-containing protein [Desulfosarcina sp. OttesenSCG-928-B08]
MNVTISEKAQIESLRDEFKAWLHETYPNLSDGTIHTYGRDAFSALNKNKRIDFWASLVAEKSLETAREKLRNYLEREKLAARVDKDAEAMHQSPSFPQYLIAVRYLKQFLDARHPTLAADWSGKTISSVNLKADFQAWMKNQKQPNGKSYSLGTIKAYTRALENATVRLELGDTVYTDLFYYTSADEFDVAQKIIRAAPGFAGIDVDAGNKAYANGMEMYARFLKELGEPSAWIFQGNPKYYDVIGAVEALGTLTWATNQYPNQIKKDDKAYIWVSGPDGGIIASGVILCDPKMTPPNPDDPYLRGDALKNEPYLAVDIQIDRRLTQEKISRAVLLADERTKQLEILTYPGATNFRVTKIQEQVIESIINGTYERIPAADTHSEKLEALLRGDDGPSEVDDAPEITYPDYTEDDFLDEVYISPENYANLKGLLLRKKNIILQGAPGTGKTFAAQRLAFSIMGEKDTSRVKVVQFHQSYSYEDFVMGYRPDGSGFRLAEGPFYKFCKIAEDDDERPYFFIIDEINRGNLSKIFGELLMLIEGDKRGEKHALRLLYKDEQFSVPANVHLIGMMNTADRSLAMIDYALRRRFAFFDMEPAFSSEGFRNRQTVIQNSGFDALVAAVELLNMAIFEDASLGTGFRIGHSYFCTTERVDDAWLSSVVNYELIPLLAEYWFDEPAKVENWSARLRDAING